MTAQTAYEINKREGQHAQPVQAQKIDRDGKY